VIHLAALPSVPRSVQDPLTTNAVNGLGHAERGAHGARRVDEGAVMASSASVS